MTPGTDAPATEGDDAPAAPDDAEEAVRTDAVAHDPETVYVTAGLLDVLLEFAAGAEPTERSIALVATGAGSLHPASEGSGDDGGGTTTERPSLDGLDPSTPVFTDFVFPDAGNSIDRVFGVALSVPPNRTHGRFLSHPTRGPELTQRDDVAARLLVAVPPWERDDVSAYDRRGRRLSLVVLDAAPPEESVPE